MLRGDIAPVPEGLNFRYLFGIGHNHAPGNMESLRKLADAFEIVGVVEPDPAWLKQHGGLQCYEGLKWMSADELLATPGLDAVAVETDGFDLIPTAQRCAERTDYAGRNYHIDPHPRFVGNDRYVVFTTTVRGEIDVALVPTTALLQATA